VRVSKAFSITALILATLGGCTSDASLSPEDIPRDAFLQGEAFVPVYRAVPEKAREAVGALSGSKQVPPPAGNQTFYLAVNKSELGKKWFLSSFLKQFYPGAVEAGAARSLGTRVVSFKMQNGKLFVFDVDDNKKTSETFTPEIVVEAYPIVDDPTFRSLPGSSNYVLIDPAAGLNRFNTVSDAFGASSVSFEIELLFSQSFRRISDGITFEQVFTGYSNLSAVGDGTLDGNMLRGQGTLGLALRRYAEGQGFVNRPTPATPHYFTTEFSGASHIVPNTGKVETRPVRWNIHAGMKPIKWTISHRAQVTQNDPKYADYDIIGALKHGIEDWNEVFGFKVFEAEVGQPGDSFADDDRNFIIWDEDPSVGYAYANWRINPNTGEVRGASVYMNIDWLIGAEMSFQDDPPASPTGFVRAPVKELARKPRPQVSFLTWAGGSDNTTCLLWAPGFRDADDANIQAPVTVNKTGTPMTKKQKVFSYIKNTVLHEIGHDLGLRHNFKGSLTPVTSSVMDYLGSEDNYLNTGVGEYDRQAIKYLYGLSDDLPTAAFCTDEHTTVDPDCNRFDEGANPYDPYVTFYKSVVGEYVTGTNANPPNRSLNNVLKYVRSGKDSATRQMAFLDAISRVKVLAPGSALPTGEDPARVDDVAQRIFKRLYLDDAKLRGEFTADPTDAAVTALVLVELRGNLMNVDGLRSWATRRVMVDILKKLQSSSALAVLKEAETDLNAKLSTLTGDDALQAGDLLARIKDATSPYFKN
jgi:hypothetical protein